jgi:hypothetical protein
MNERIKRLAREAGLEFDDDLVLEPEPIYYTTQKDLEKFALLIVRECARHCDLLLDHKISSEWSRGTHDCSRAIKKHFGVEL